MNFSNKFIVDWHDWPALCIVDVHLANDLAGEFLQQAIEAVDAKWGAGTAASNPKLAIEYAGIIAMNYAGLNRADNEHAIKCQLQHIDESLNCLVSDSEV